MRGNSGGSAARAWTSQSEIPARRLEPDQAFEIAVKRVLHVKMHTRCVALFKQQHTGGEHGGKDNPHRGAGLDPAKAADGLDHQDRDKRRRARAQHHRPGGDGSGHKEGQHDTGQDHMADGIADQRLTAQQQEVPRQRAGDGRQGADQDRGQRQGDELGAHHCPAPGAMARRRRKSVASTPRRGAARSESAKSAKDRSTISGPVGRPGAVADRAAPP